MADYGYMRENQTILSVGDTVTSPGKSFQMTLENDGLSLTPQGGSKVWINNKCLHVQSCELVKDGLVITGHPGYTYKVTTFTPYVLDVQDNGEVVIYNGDGTASYVIYAYQSGSSLQSLTLHGEAVHELNHKILELEKRARTESGFPGPIEKPTGT